ncbi:GNAT family N-acetyltransferase, partial [Enterococcus faecalis]
MGEIKQLTIEDAPALQEISIETYTDTFGPYNTPENMQAYLVEAYNLEKLQKELANPHSDFYFIFVDNQLAGYMKLNRETAQTEPMGPEKLEVERLYILPAFKGKKLGTQLLELA